MGSERKDWTERESLEMASRAFDLFTLDEKKRALERFAQLRYPSAVDRFFESVHSVIVGKDVADAR